MNNSLFYEKKHKKILIYAKELDGGTERFVENLSNLINESSNQTSEVIVNKTNNRQHIKVKKVGFRTDGHFVVVKCLFTIINFFHLLYYVIKSSPDVIFSIEAYANTLSLLLKRIYKKPYLIISTHTNLDYQINTNQSRLFSSILKKVISNLYNNTGAHYTPSAELKNFLVKNYLLLDNKFQVIPYPSITNQIKKYSRRAISNKKIRAELSLKGTIKIISIGRFEKQKLFEHLLEAMSIISKNIKNIKLYLIGDGTMRKQYVEIIKKLNLKEYVSLINWQKNPFKYMKYANVFILISNFEGFPHVLLEALSLDIPIISSDVDFGPREILGYGRYGILLKNNTPEEIAKQVVRLLKNKRFYENYKSKSKQRALIYGSRQIREKYKGLLLI